MTAGAGVVGFGVTGGFVGSGGRGRGVAAGSGSGFGFGLGGISGSGLGVDGRGVTAGIGFAVAGSGVIAGRIGFGFGRGVALGAGVAGTVLISSRALRKARFFCSSVIPPLCWARSAAPPIIESKVNSSRVNRTRRML